MTTRVGPAGTVDRRPRRRPVAGMADWQQSRGYVAVNPAAEPVDGIQGCTWPIRGQVRADATAIPPAVQVKIESGTATACLYLTAYEAAGLADLLTRAAADARTAGGR